MGRADYSASPGAGGCRRGRGKLEKTCAGKPFTREGSKVQSLSRPPGNRTTSCNPCIEPLWRERACSHHPNYDLIGWLIRCHSSDRIVTPWTTDFASDLRVC